MGALSGNHEIVEVRGKYDSEPHISRNAVKKDFQLPSRKYSIEDDINKLFASIDIRNSRRDVGQPGPYASNRSAMKRPMRVGSPQMSGIGISESVSLKQALRGLCISQASEMAAIKKRMSRPSASPGMSETEAAKSVFRAMVIEAGEAGRPLNKGKGNLVEISLVPEKFSLNVSEKATESTVQEKVPVFHEIVPISGERSITAAGDNMEHADNLQPVSSSLVFGTENSPTKTSKQSFGSSKQSLRTQNFLKKKLVSKTASVAKSRLQHNAGRNDGANSMRSGIGSRIQEKGREGSDMESPVSSSNTLAIGAVSVEPTQNKLGLDPPILPGEEGVVAKADERYRDQTEISQSSKSSIQEHSSTSYSEDSYGSSRSGYRPHMSRDLRWEAISSVRKHNGSLGLRHFKLLRKLGGGDIGSVYLSELIGTGCLFAVKVMNNDLLVNNKKMMRAQTEKEILEMLDHPFLPTLYACFTTTKFSCLVMEYCPGGDLHVLRQKQPTKSFSEQAARFYVAEVLLALEYLHMLGVVYRDLKPENILVREDGHIMLSDFDLSLRCSVNPTLLKSAAVIEPPKKTSSSPCSGSSCIDPFCLQPSWQLSCFTPRFLSAASKTKKLKSELASQVIPLPQLVVEPTGARSNSFVGTHEYLAPEIVKGEGHGSAVDWWTFGIFLFELLYGKTPFKGSTNEDTITNVVSEPLKFPECPMVSSQARDLIKRLLKKEPENRLGSVKGAAEIKQHPFFEGLNWALIRCEKPPEMPRFFDLGNVIPDASPQSKSSKSQVELQGGGDGIEFEMF